MLVHTTLNPLTSRYNMSVDQPVSTAVAPYAPIVYNYTPVLPSKTSDGFAPAQLLLV